MIGTHLAYSQMIAPFVMAGAGMALVFAPSAAGGVTGAAARELAGVAEGA
jgi:hypothetical protein